MRKMFVLSAVLFVVACVGVGSALCARSGQDGGEGEFSIYVAPGNIAKSAACNWVTIHTDVAYASVDDDGAAVAVDDEAVKVASVYSDDCGNVVVKVRFADVVAIVGPPSATVTLTLTVGGADMSASETVAVKN